MTETSNAWVRDWVRWALMPFAAIAGAVAGSLVAIIFFWLGMKLSWGASEDGWYFLYVLPVIIAAIFGYLYAYIAYEMAPRGKMIAGTVMVTILGIFSLLGITQTWAMPDHPVGEAIQASVGVLATMISAILTLKNASDL